MPWHKTKVTALHVCSVSLSFVSYTCLCVDLSVMCFSRFFILFSGSRSSFLALYVRRLKNHDPTLFPLSYIYFFHCLFKTVVLQDHDSQCLPFFFRFLLLPLHNAVVFKPMLLYFHTTAYDILQLHTYYLLSGVGILSTSFVLTFIFLMYAGFQSLACASSPAATDVSLST